MGQTLEVVKQIESRAFRLIQKLNSFEEKLLKSQQEKEELEKEKKQLQQKIDRLASENEHLKSANAILGSKDYKRETKLKINRLIREVDSCIVQLTE